MITKVQKETIVSQFRDKLKSSQGFLVFEYHGLTVADMTRLRREVREKGGELKVFKNKLVKKALAGTQIEKVLSDDFKGPLASVFGLKDMAAAAKVIMGFEKGEAPLKIRTGILDNCKISINEIKELAKLPSREILLSKCVGTLAAPLQAFLNLLTAVSRELIYVLKAVEGQKKEKEG